MKPLEAFNNCHATCKYKGHEYGCPFIQEIEKEKITNEINRKS